MFDDEGVSADTGVGGGGGSGSGGGGGGGGGDWWSTHEIMQLEQKTCPQGMQIGLAITSMQIEQSSVGLQKRRIMFSLVNPVLQQGQKVVIAETTYNTLIT